MKEYKEYKLIEYKRKFGYKKVQETTELVELLKKKLSEVKQTIEKSRGISERVNKLLSKAKDLKSKKKKEKRKRKKYKNRSF